MSYARRETVISFTRRGQPHLAELLPPDSTLSAVAIEGFSPEEASSLSDEAHDIADLVRYRGGRNLTSANKVETLQFKYSVGAAHKPMRASEMARTLQKFAAADTDIQAVRPIHDNFATYELITNRPIDSDTIVALDTLRFGAAVHGQAARRAEQLTAAIGLEGEALRSFANRLTLTGTRESLDRSRAWQPADARFLGWGHGQPQPRSVVQSAQTSARTRRKSGTG